MFALSLLCSYTPGAKGNALIQSLFLELPCEKHCRGLSERKLKLGPF